jgi:hypothetical protein
MVGCCRGVHFWGWVWYGTVQWNGADLQLDQLLVPLQDQQSASFTIFAGRTAKLLF